MKPILPDHVKPYAKTDVFTEETVPNKLINEHNTKANVWGKLHVLEGALDYVVPASEAQSKQFEYTISEGEHIIIEPQLTHFVRMTGRVRFFVEFHK